MDHKPVPIVITPAVIDRLRDSIAAAVPQPRTGAAFVNLDTRVLAGLLLYMHVATAALGDDSMASVLDASLPDDEARAASPKRCGGCGGTIWFDRMLGTRCKCAGGDWQPHAGEPHRGQR